MSLFLNSRSFISRLSVAFLVSLTVTLIWTSIAHPEKTQLLKAGDFPAYYTVAKILSEGKADNLFTPGLQNEIQQKYWQDPNKEFLYFRYPPYVAVLLSPLAVFGPLFAKTVFVFFLTICLIGAFMLASKFAPILKQNWLATTAVTVACMPITINLLCGQFSPWIMVCYILMIYGIHQNSGWGDYLCGIAAGMMLVKPQFGLIWILWLSMFRSKKIMLGWLVVAVIFYGMGAAIMGWKWPILWLHQTAWAQEPILKIDQHAMISLNAVMRATEAAFHFSDSAIRIFSLGGYTLSAIIWIGMAIQFWKSTKIRETTLRHGRRESLMLLGGPLSLLVSPHTMFYEFGICLIACAKFFDQKNRRHILGLILILIITDLSMIFRDQLPIQPLFLIVIGCFSFIRLREIPCP